MGKVLLNFMHFVLIW